MARLTERKVAEQLAKLKGNVAAVARAFGVTRQSAWRYIQERPALKELMLDYREERIDNAESAIDRAILNGEAWAVLGTLKTLGKDRGWVERTEQQVTGKGGGAVEHTVTVVVKRDRNFFGRGTTSRTDAVPDSDAGEPGAVQDPGVRPAMGQDGAGADGGA